MILVGLTGGISTGKSTVSGFLTEMGLPAIDLDVISRTVVQPGWPAWKKLRNTFGSQFFHTESGELKRKELGDMIFQNSEARRKLNGIVHPEVRWEMLREILRLWLSGNSVIVLDTPLLFETRGDQLVQLTIVVTCSAENQLDRLMSRNEFSREEAENRISAQMSLEEKRKRADVVIENDGSKEKTKMQVSDAVSGIRNLGFLTKIRGFFTFVIFALFVLIQRLYLEVFG